MANNGYIGIDALDYRDKDFDNCVLALSHDLSDSVVTDKSPTGAAITEEGTSGLATTQTKFTGQSMHFVGTVGNNFYLTTPGDLDGVFDEDFTWSCWVRITSLAAVNAIMVHTGSGGYWSVNVQTSGRVDVNIDTDAAAYQSCNSATGACSTGTWVWIAVQRDGDTWLLYVGDTLVDTATAAGGFGTLSVVEIGENTNTTPIIGDASELIIHDKVIDVTLPVRARPVRRYAGGVYGADAGGFIGVYS
jgi:hypothetical protein